jgi:hypothetical protein
MERATTLLNTEPPTVGFSQCVISKTGNTLSNKRRSDVKKSHIDVDNIRDEKNNSKNSSDETKKAGKDLKAFNKVLHDDHLTGTDLARLKECRDVLKNMELSHCTNLLTKQQSIQ